MVYLALTGNVPRTGAFASIAFTLVFGISVTLTLRRYYRDNLLPRRIDLERDTAELQ